MEWNDDNRVIDSDEKESRREKEQRLQRQQEIDDIKRILATKEGLRFFKRFFDEGHMFTSCMTGNSWTYHNEGKRDFVLRFFSDVSEACPEKIVELMVRK